MWKLLLIQLWSKHRPFYCSFQNRRIMVGIGSNDSWRRIDVGFDWIMVANKKEHKQTVVLTSGAKWDVLNRLRLSFNLSARQGKRLWLKIWWKFEQFTECFQIIFDWPLAEKVDSHFHQLQRVSTSLPKDVNIWRIWMFTKDGWRSLEGLPPTPWGSIFRELFNSIYPSYQNRSSGAKSSGSSQEASKIWREIIPRSHYRKRICKCAKASSLNGTLIMRLLIVNVEFISLWTWHFGSYNFWSSFCWRHHAVMVINSF